MKTKIRIYKTILNNKKFKIIINWKHNTALANFITDEPLLSVEMDDYVVLHYGSKTKDLMGFTILHLKEFLKYIKTNLKRYIREQKLKDQEWLKQKAEQSIYNVINKKQYRSFWQIPQPFWHMPLYRHNKKT